MSSALVIMSVLLGSSVVMAFVLQPSDIQPRRCQGVDSWRSIRTGLLEALGLRAEPRLAAGGLDAVREQWQRTFSTIAHRVKNAASAPEVPGSSVSQDNGNGTSLKCCSVTSEIFMKDLGWENWVIHPLSLTMVQCALCSAADDAVQCVSPPSSGQDATAEERSPCCLPTAHEMVPILYMDELSNVVISSVRLPRGCGCGPGGVVPPPGDE